MASVVQGRAYSGPKPSSTRVVSGGPVTVKSTGQRLTTSSGSARAPTAPREVSVPGTSTMKVTTVSQPPTLNRFGQPVSSAYPSQQISPTSTVITPQGGVSTANPQAYSITHPGTFVPTSQPTTSSGGGGTTASKLPSSFTQPTLVSSSGTTQITAKSGTQTIMPTARTQQATTTAPRSSVITLQSQPSAYQTPTTFREYGDKGSNLMNNLLIPSAYAGTEAELLKSSGVRSYSPQAYQSYSSQLLSLETPRTITFTLGPTREKATALESSQYTQGGMISLGHKQTFGERISAPFKRFTAGFKTDNAGQYQGEGRYGPELLGVASKQVLSIALLSKVPEAKATKYATGLLSQAELPLLEMKAGGALQKLGYYGYTGAKALGVGELTYLGYKKAGETTSFTPEGKLAVASSAFKSSYAAAESAAQSKMGLVSGFVYGVSPVASRTISKITGKDITQSDAFSQQFVLSQERQGISREEALQNLQLAQTERGIRGQAQLASFIGSSSVIELGGRGGFLAEFKKASSEIVTQKKLPLNVFMKSTKVLAPLGFAEGSGQSIIQQQSEGQRISASQTLYGGAFGLASASILGGVIAVGSATGRKTVSRFASAVGNLGDISEKPGDILADYSVTRRYYQTGVKTEIGTIKSKGPGVYTYSSTYVPEERARVNAPVKTPSSLNSAFGSSKVPSNIPIANRVRTPTDIFSSAYRGTAIPTPTNIPSQSNTNIPSPVPSPVPSNTNVPVPINTNIPVPTNVMIPVPSSTDIPVPTNTQIPVFTPQGAFPILPFGGFGGGELGSGEGGKKRRKGKYLPSFAALYLNIRGKAPKAAGGIYSGLEFRPILSSGGDRGRKRLKYSKMKASGRRGFAAI